MWLNVSVATLNTMLKNLDTTSLVYIYIYILINLDLEKLLSPKHVFSLYVSAQKWTEVDINGLNWTKWKEVDRMDRIGLNGNKADEIGLNRTKVDRVGPNDPNRTKVDRMDD